MIPARSPPFQAKLYSSLTTANPLCLVGKGGGPRRSPEQVEADFLQVMAELRMLLRKDDIPSKLVVFMVGYTHPQSTGFLKAKSNLRKAKLIELSKGEIRLTEDGVKAAPQDVEFPAGNGDVQERLRSILHQKVKPIDKFDKIFDRLLDGQDHTKEELLAAADYNHPQSTGFLKTMAALRELDLIEKVGPKVVRLTDIAFPCGRDGASLGIFEEHP